MNNKDEMKKWMQISESYQQVDEGILGILKGIGIAGARFIGLVARLIGYTFRILQLAGWGAEMGTGLLNTVSKKLRKNMITSLLNLIFGALEGLSGGVRGLSKILAGFLGAKMPMGIGESTSLYEQMPEENKKEMMALIQKAGNEIDAFAKSPEAQAIKDLVSDPAKKQEIIQHFEQNPPKE